MLVIVLEIFKTNDPWHFQKDRYKANIEKYHFSQLANQEVLYKQLKSVFIEYANIEKPELVAQNQHQTPGARFVCSVWNKNFWRKGDY